MVIATKLNQILLTAILRHRLTCCLDLALATLNVRDGAREALINNNCSDTAAFEDFKGENWHDVNITFADAGPPDADDVMMRALREPHPDAIPLWHVAVTSHPDGWPTDKLPDVLFSERCRRRHHRFHRNFRLRHCNHRCRGATARMHT